MNCSCSSESDRDPNLPQISNQKVILTVSAEELTKNLSSSPEVIASCTECHADLPEEDRRDEITALHGKLFTLLASEYDNSWCIDCHQVNARDSLNLAMDKSLTFSESFGTCGQCHPAKLREWELGVHGKRVGDWSDEKVYMLRIPIDNPHRPKIKYIIPEPPPARLQ